MGFWEQAKRQTKDTGGLLQTTYNVFWDDPDLFSPVIRLSIYETIHYTALLTGVLLLILTEFYLASGIILAMSLTLIPLFKYYYRAFQKSVLSHETYQVICGEDATYNGSKETIKNREGSIALLAIVDVIITKLLNSADDEDNTGIAGFILNLLIEAAEEVWDLLENYVVPAIVVDDVSITEIPSKLKGLKNNVPGTLTGVFGIDLGTSMLSNILFPAVLISWVFFIGVGVATSPLTTHTFSVSGVNVAYIPLIIAVYTTILFFGLVGVITESLKATYFTAMYTAIQHPDTIEDSRRQGLTNYLSLGDSPSPTENTPNQRTTEKDQAKRQTSQKQVSNNVKKLAKAFKKARKPGNKKTLFKKAKRKGFSNEQIRQAWQLANTDH